MPGRTRGGALGGQTLMQGRGRSRLYSHDRKRGPSSRDRGQRVGSRLLTAIALILLLAIAVSLVLYATLPDVSDAETRVQALLHAHGGVDTGLPLPSRVGRAIVAIEDERFYTHHGIDLLALLRAAHVDLTTPEVQGGSTITQQLAKALYVRDDHSLRAKAQMLGLAVELEGHYSKTQILEMYLNAIYYGDGHWGIDQASRAYFGLSPRTLGWADASLLAGLPQAPSAYALTRHFARARARQRHVLTALVRSGVLTQQAADAAYAAAATVMHTP